ncbi:hypothetical protein OAQ21_05100 [Flavobacteriales bacterium]|nr:hypothetical protein [Flavobacteriales bacterium]
MKKILILLVMFSTLSVYSQSLTGITEEGKKVILNNDGTWTYKVELTETTNSSTDLSDCKYWKDEVDDFTGDVKRYTKNKLVGKSKYSSLSIELRRFDKSYLMYVKYSGDLGCVSSRSTIMIKLLNGEMINLTNFGDIDCSDMNMYFKLPQSTIDQLLKSPIEKIRVQGTEYYSDIEKMILPNYFIENFKCIKI